MSGSTEWETGVAESRCPLCGSSELATVPGTGDREYRDCAGCGLLSLHPRHFLSAEDELAHYGTHENDPSDPRYRAFLNRLAVPLAAGLKPGARGLDFGAGPGPTLSVMLEEAGFPTRNFDPFFAPGRRVLENTYDFVVCTETVEHFHRPDREFDLLNALLRRGGRLGVMTEVLPPDTEFAGWWYRRDPTHVSFYRDRTFQWLAKRYAWHVERAARTVFLFLKPEALRAAGR